MGAYTAAIGVSMLLGPLAGRGLYQWLGYEGCFAFMSALTAVLGVSVVLFGGMRKEPPTEITFGIGPLISAPIYAHYGFHLVCFFVALLALLGAIQVCCSLSAHQCEP